MPVPNLGQFQLYLSDTPLLGPTPPQMQREIGGLESRRYQQLGLFFVSPLRTTHILTTYIDRHRSGKTAH